MKFNYINRIRFLTLCVVAFALLLISRLYFLQVVEGSSYADRADRQYTSTSQKIFDRGSIFFRNKDGSLVSAATLKSGYIISINPEIIKNPEEVWDKLSQVLQLDKEVFLAKANKKNDPYEEIANKVEEDIGVKIRDMKITGVGVHKEKWRFYPGSNIASHVVGIMGYRGNEYAGRYGLERQYDSYLVREDGAYKNFFVEIFSNIKDVAIDEETLEADIVTTIEPTVQSYLQNTIASTTDRWQSDLTGGIVMDPKTGEIYAMAVYPTFDLNNSSSEKDARIFSNPIVENIYEMGSIIKVLTLASGIDAGVINANTTYYDRGFTIVSGKTINNFDSKERGFVNMQDVLSQSLNTGTVYTQSLLGNERFTEYMLKFGLENRTGIELPNEARNIVTSLKSKSNVDLASASFGQSLALTPISTIGALSVVANGGFTVKPHLVKTIKYKVGVSKDTEIPIGDRVIKRETSEELSRMMAYSVDNILLNGSLKIPTHTVSVKTGTAQIPKPQGGGYYDDRVLHSFVGHFPSYNPKFIVLLYTVNPKGVRFGSETLSRPFMSLAEFLINYYEIPPDR